jgi:hypothetical protein
MALALSIREIYRYQGAKWGSHAYKNFFNTPRDEALGLASFERELVGASDEGKGFSYFDFFFFGGIYKTLKF